MVLDLDGSIIYALSANKETSSIVIAGRNVLKVFNVSPDGNGFQESHNLRQGGRVNLNYGALDVSWSQIDENRIATAATNGKVIVWNLGATGRDRLETQWNAHSRSVNRVAFHHSEPNYVLSASQDCAVKLFDLRNTGHTLEFLSGNESIRDVKFSPTQPYTFAAADEAGNVKLWDLRLIDKPQKIFSAHSAPVFSIDFHPSARNWIATASRDKLIKVWDFGKGVPSCEYAVQTIAPVNVVRWRREREWQLASASLVMDFSIHVWDVRRPFIPFASFDRHKDVCTGIVWRNHAHSFFSAGKDGMVLENRFSEALRPGDFANPVAVDISPVGEVLYAASNRVLQAAAGSLKASPVPAESPSDELKPGSVKLFGSRLSSASQSADKGDLFRGPIQSQLILFPRAAPEDLLSCDWLVLTGRRYRLGGASFPALCDHNSVVARELSRPHIAQTWLILKTLFPQLGSESVGGSGVGGDVSESSEPPAAAVKELSRRGASEAEDYADPFPIPDSKLAYSVGGGGVASSLEDSEEAEWSVEAEAFTPRRLEALEAAQSRPGSGETPAWPSGEEPEWEDGPGRRELILHPLPPIRLIRTEPLVKPALDPSPMLETMLRHYVEAGDVQMAVSCLLVLGEKGKDLISTDTQLHWYMAYLDVLEQFEEFVTQATVISLCPLPQIQELSTDQTFVSLSCGACGKATGPKGWVCERCGGLGPPCSICGELVRGLFVWCRGCEHGGHQAHLKAWFKANAACPAGCGHRCEFAYSANEFPPRAL